jgi:hypothetical protein
MRSTKAQFSILLLSYAILRLFSYAFPPDHFTNTILTLGITILASVFLLKKNTFGWYIVAGELILGGTGTFLQAFSLTLRSYLLLISLSIFFIQEWKNISWYKRKIIGILLLLTAISFSFVHGWQAGHQITTMLSTSVPYLFLLYYFPLQKLLQNEDWKRWCLTALGATIVGQTLFLLFTFIGFASGQFLLQGAYYHWFRDIVGGKITWVAFNFYRIVINEQLLLIPVLLYTVKQLIDRQSKLNYIYWFLLLLLLSINITRIYLIALIFGLILLFNKTNWKRWLTFTSLTLATFLFIFSLTYLAASGGKSFGLEVFGLRLQSIVAPRIEDSSLSRVLLLPKVLALINTHPLIGNGLGSVVTIFSPVTKQTITTNQLDWGYLQIIAELGMIGFLIWTFFLTTIFSKLKKTAGWPLASFGALLIINITSPALFHVFGIIWLTFLLARSNDACPQ